MSQTPACPDVPDEMLDAAMQEWFGEDYEGGRLLGCCVAAQELVEEGLRNVLRIALADRASRALPSTALAARPEEGWRPIETAPKDGTLILVHISRGLMDVVSWFDGGWRETTDALRLRTPPTHWMPLPPAPSTPPTAGDGHD